MAHHTPLTSEIPGNLACKGGVAATPSLQAKFPGNSACKGGVVSHPLPVRELKLSLAGQAWRFN